MAAAATGIASLKAGLMIVAPVLAVAAPLVLAALFLRPEGSSAHQVRGRAVQARAAATARPPAVLMPAVSSRTTAVATRVAAGRPATTRAARRRGVLVTGGQPAGALLMRASTSPSRVNCSASGLQGLACGGAPAVRSAIQAQLSYNRLNSHCAGLTAAYGRGGLEGATIYATNSAQLAARRDGLSPQAEEVQVRRALQQALVTSGSAPRDVLNALTELQSVYAGCDGYNSARNALQSAVALIQSQLGFDQPTATTGFGAAFANPGLPAAGAVGTASYLTQGGS